MVFTRTLPVDIKLGDQFNIKDFNDTAVVSNTTVLAKDKTTSIKFFATISASPILYLTIDGEPRPRPIYVAAKSTTALPPSTQGTLTPTGKLKLFFSPALSERMAFDNSTTLTNSFEFNYAENPFAEVTLDQKQNWSVERQVPAMTDDADLKLDTGS